jgi:hypothetical protein
VTRSKRGGHLDSKPLNQDRTRDDHHCISAFRFLDFARQGATLGPPLLKKWPVLGRPDGAAAKGVPAMRVITAARPCLAYRQDTSGTGDFSGMLPGEPECPPTGPQPGDEYLTTSQARIRIGLCGNDMGRLPLPGIKQGFRGSGNTGRRGWLYRREHVELVRKIRQETGIGANAALCVALAKIEGRL